MTATAPLDCLKSTATPMGSSRWGEHARCHKAHHLRYVEGVVQRNRPQHFSLGTAVHGALQWWELHPAAPCWREVLDAGLNAQVIDQWTQLEAIRLLEGYEAKWGGDNAGWDEWEIMGVEVPFDLGGYTGCLDLVLRRGDAIVVVDHKTRKSAFPKSTDARFAKARGYATRPQFLALVMGAQHLYHLDEPPELLVNAVVKTKVPGYDRLRVNVTPEAAATWWEHQQRLELTQDATPCYEACAPEIGSRCWAFNWCHGSAEVRALDYVHASDAAHDEDSAEEDQDV